MTWINDRMVSAAKEVDIWPEWKKKAFANAGNHKEVCLNEQYDRGYVQGQGDDVVRLVSCPCSKCTPRF